MYIFLMTLGGIYIYIYIYIYIKLLSQYIVLSRYWKKSQSVDIIQYNKFNNFFLITKRPEHLNIVQKGNTQKNYKGNMFQTFKLQKNYKDQ